MESRDDNFSFAVVWSLAVAFFFGLWQESVSSFAFMFFMCIPVLAVLSDISGACDSYGKRKIVVSDDDN